MALVQRGTALYAADGAAGDLFGQSAALSATGTVLAVGAPLRASGALPECGGVYVYDWSGGAWVARGSVLTAPTPVDYSHYGYDVALSADGLVLVVGAPEEGHGAYVGVVYVYDWSGSAWVLRGTVTENTANNVNYGQVVALSGNGLVLAIGDYFNAGFYIYDWSGSAWVPRGSLLTSPSFYNIGGDSAALSYDGAILAAGNSTYTSGGLTSRGAVVLYDYAASVWTERAALVLATDAASNDFLGSAVALNSNGTSLCVGAYGWTSTTGKAYRFTYAAGAWTQADTFFPADAAVNDQFGAGIALSSNGLVAVVGAAGWEGTAADMGGAYTFDLVLDSASAPTTLTMITAPYGPVDAPTTLYIATAAASAAPTTLTVAYPTGTASAPTTLTMQATGTATAPTALALVDASEHWPLWSLRVVIDGVDVSAQLTGQASVDAGEGAARVAQFTLKPPAGAVAPLDWVGKPVSIDYLQTMAGSEVARRVFTGRIDTPRFSPDTSLLDFDCVDDLQNRVAALGRPAIDALVGGKFTAAVQGEILDNWDYAQARLSTVAGSLDAGAHGGLRLTPWVLASSWATFGDGDLIYQTSTLQFPQRSTLINKVTVEFEYRYLRLRQRYTSVGWSGGQADMAPCGWQYPTQQDILGAAGGSGWTVTLGIFSPAPVKIPHSSGGFVYTAAGSIDMAILYMAQRHSQTVTETYTLPVTAPESIAANGELLQTLHGALASSFDGGAWESALDVAPLMPTGGETDWAPDAPRYASDYAIETLLEQANVKILGSHRSARVGNACLCNPDLDLDKRVTIATTAVNASGKLARVRHVFDLQEGSALTEFEIACFGVGGAGIIAPTALASPAPPASAAATQDWPAAVPSMTVNTYGVTPYQTGLMGLLLNPPQTISVEDIPGIGSKSFPNPFYVPGSYPATGFRMQMPGVADADRNPLDRAVGGAYQILIPSDTLTFTVP